MRWLVVAVCVLGLGCSGSGEGSDGGSGGGAAGGGAGGGSGGGATGGGTGGGAAGGGSGTGLFSQPHPWTADVSALPKASSSDAIIGALMSAGGWGNTNRFQIDFSLTVQRTSASTPRVTVTGRSGYYTPDCDTVPLQLPLPPGGAIEGESGYACSGGDCHVLIVAEDERKLYEVYQADGSATALSSACVAVWDLDRAYPAALRGEQCTSADAAGLPIAALLPTADEVASGSVDHALRFILPNARMRRGVYVRPATHAGGPSSTDANAPPYGVRFRLKASFNEATLPTEGARVLARALKKHGMILSDGGNIALTMADDRFTTAKWSQVGVTPQSLLSMTVQDFEVVDLSAPITLTYTCVRTP